MTRLKIGVFGTKGEGKTVGMVAWHLERSGDGISLTTSDQATMKYFRPLAEGLAAGEFPPRTVAAPPFHLKWQATTSAGKYDLECIDFAGEFADPVLEAQTPKFKNEVQQWMAKCDALLIFIDSTRHENPAYFDAIDQLFGEMLRQKTHHQGRRRVVGMVLTKGDELPGTSPHTIQDEIATEVLLGQHRVYQYVKDRLAKLKDVAIAKTFLVSAVGWRYAHLYEQLSRKVEPCNLFAPLRWVTETADRVVTHNHARRMLLHTMWGFVGMLLLACLWYGGHRNALSAYQRYDDFAEQHPLDDDASQRIRFFDEQLGANDFDWLWWTHERRERTVQLVEHDRRMVRRAEAKMAFQSFLTTDDQLANDGLHPQRYLAASQFQQTHGEYISETVKQCLKGIMTDTEKFYQEELAELEDLLQLTPRSAPDYNRIISHLNSYTQRRTAIHTDRALARAQQIRDLAYNNLREGMVKAVRDLKR